MRATAVEERRLVQNVHKQGKRYKFITETLGRSQNFVTNSLKTPKSLHRRGVAQKRLLQPRII